MKKTFFGRHAISVLMVVFFLVPFGFRGARLALENMKNDVKDWLPDDFPETAEMEWFWKYFAGERFVIASWEGCVEGDAAYQLFLKKLEMPLPPSKVAAKNQPPAKSESESTPELAAPEAAASPPADGPSLHGRSLVRDYEFIGDRLGLFVTDDVALNWGGRNEKWLRGGKNEWYFITPEGELHLWKSTSPMFDWLGQLWRSRTGAKIEGEIVASFGPEDGPWYYEDPHRLEAQLFRSVQTGPDLLGALTNEDGVLASDPAEARRRLDGLVYGPDGKQTCLILTLTDNGLRDFHRVLGRGILGRPMGRLFTLAADCGLSQEALRIGGPPVDNVAIDEEGSVTLIRLVSLSVALGLGLAFACFRSITATMIVFCVGGVSAVMSLAVVGWSGAGCDAILMSMPSLVYVLGISGAVHLINYYRDAVEEHGPVGAPERAVAHGWRPAVFCSVTTALGLISLNTSEIVPIAKFGLYSAVAVMATLIMLFTYLPAALEIWPQTHRIKSRERKPDSLWYERVLAHAWDAFGRFIIRHHYAVAGACVVVIVVVGYGVNRIDTSINLLKLFDKDAKILADYAWLESRLGKLVPMEVVVKFAPETLRMETQGDESPTGDAERQFQLSFLERMELVDRVQRIIDRQFGPQGEDVAGRSVSSATFAPALPDTFSFARRRVTSRRLEDHRNAFLQSDYMRLDETGNELWRISLRIGALQDVDYGQFVHQLRDVVEPVLAAQRARDQILRAIADRRGEEGYAGAGVCLLGASSKFFATADAETPPGDAETTGESPPVTAEPVGLHQPTERQQRLTVDADAIFADTLRSLLMASRLRVDWHDPRVDPVPETFGDVISQFDCVVNLDRTAAYDARQVEQRSALLVDLRQIAYDPRAAQPAEAQAAPPAISAVYTGVVPIVYKAQRTLLNSLMQSTFWSFATITPVMMLVSRSIAAGTVAMLPNILPVFVIFGGMGWLGIEVDIGSMMTASIALGVAVDDTIHFLNWFREELRHTDDRKVAILAAYKRCATPTFQAALISGLGLSVFAFSTFSPTQRFGFLMLTILFAGVVAELVFFPALLAGPLGRVFKPLGGRHDAHAVPAVPVPVTSVCPAPHDVGLQNPEFRFDSAETSRISEPRP